jgi:hypothetical protein
VLLQDFRCALHKWSEQRQVQFLIDLVQGVLQLLLEHGFAVCVDLICFVEEDYEACAQARCAMQYVCE